MYVFSHFFELIIASWHCESSHEEIGWAFEIAYFAILLLWGFWLAYRTRSVKVTMTTIQISYIGQLQ